MNLSILSTSSIFPTFHNFINQIILPTERTCPRKKFAFDIIMSTLTNKINYAAATGELFFLSSQKFTALLVSHSVNSNFE